MHHRRALSDLDVFGSASKVDWSARLDKHLQQVSITGGHCRLGPSMTASATLSTVLLRNFWPARNVVPQAGDGHQLHQLAQALRQVARGQEQGRQPPHHEPAADGVPRRPLRPRRALQPHAGRRTDRRLRQPAPARQGRGTQASALQASEQKYSDAASNAQEVDGCHKRWRYSADELV